MSARDGTLLLFTMAPLTLPAHAASAKRCGRGARASMRAAGQAARLGWAGLGGQEWHMMGAHGLAQGATKRPGVPVDIWG